jgi:hypothetical protein
MIDQLRTLIIIHLSINHINKYHQVLAHMVLNVSLSRNQAPLETMKLQRN